MRMATVTGTAGDNGTFVWGAFVHQDLIDDAMVNPVPALVDGIVATAYASAEARGASIVQWRITFNPYPIDDLWEIGRSPEDIAWHRGRRIIKMTAHTVPNAEPAP